MSEITWLEETDHRVLTALCATDGAIGLDALAAAVSLDAARVKVVVDGLAARDLATASESVWVELRLAPKGKALDGSALPERTVLEALAAGPGEARIAELAELAGLDKKAAGESLRWLTDKGWATREKDRVVVTDAGRAAVGAPGADEALLAALAGDARRPADDVARDGVDLDAARALLAKRKLVDERRRVDRSAAATTGGRALIESGVEARREVTQLTPELLADGGWRSVALKPYDVTLDAERWTPGKEHPFRRVLDETRRVFLELGFEETASPYCESSFWDFDALFQPQDHPARDMQDTFYVKTPAEARLPDAAIVDRVRRTHEDGGDTGSVGWGYTWSEATSKTTVLRTHTTAASIRALADDPNPPRKVFCVGPVFRNETITYKHLPVFHQIDGIIVDEHASLASLLGTLKAFYNKMGFDRFQFRPAFFPYTEPSLEVFVWHDGKGDWVEMGGAGIFRPEVTQPLGCSVPVLAWGLGLERLAMFRFGIERIRDLYDASLDWLKETARCQW